MVDFRITFLKSRGRRIPVQATVQRKVIADLLFSPMHLKGLELADPDFGTPEAIDLVGTEIFGQVVVHGWRFGCW